MHFEGSVRGGGARECALDHPRLPRPGAPGRARGPKRQRGDQRLAIPPVLDIDGRSLQDVRILGRDAMKNASMVGWMLCALLSPVAFAQADKVLEGKDVTESALVNALTPEPQMRTRSIK